MYVRGAIVKKKGLRHGIENIRPFLSMRSWFERF
jgi:hypothetical protein